MKNYYITDDVTLSDAIDYVEEIYEPEIIEPYIDNFRIKIKKQSWVIQEPMTVSLFVCIILIQL